MPCEWLACPLSGVTCSAAEAVCRLGTMCAPAVIAAGPAQQPDRQRRRVLALQGACSSAVRRRIDRGSAWRQRNTAAAASATVHAPVESQVPAAGGKSVHDMPVNKCQSYWSSCSALFNVVLMPCITSNIILPFRRRTIHTIHICTIDCHAPRHHWNQDCKQTILRNLETQNT